MKPETIFGQPYMLFIHVSSAIHDKLKLYLHDKLHLISDILLIA